MIPFARQFLFLVFALSAFCSIGNAERWIFTTSVFPNAVAIKPNEICRKWAFSDDFIKEKCKADRNSYLCTGNIEKFIISVYSSQKECEEYLAYSRKATK